VRFVIIADSDRQGESGVGDYALLLARLLRSSNINVVFEALGPSCRSSRSALVDRVQKAQPDWVSFHFVPYAYAHRGLVGKATLPWEKLRGRVGTHIMFHEIWIGAHQGAPLRQRPIGFLQRLGIQQVLRQLKPDVVHCTNPLYSAMLHRAGITNSVLPLFGVIPVESDGVLDPYIQLLPNLVPGSKRSDWIVAALFGKIYPSDHLLPALQWLVAKCLPQGKHLLVVSLGHCPTAAATFEEIGQCFSEPGRPYFHITGKLDASVLSYWIQGADCGLATTPFNIIDKSSSAVAFVEHGIPVIVLDDGAPIRGMDPTQPDLAPEFWLFGDKRLDDLEILPPRREPQPRRDQVVNQFLVDLNIDDR
jgi:hypothetical protein